MIQSQLEYILSCFHLDQIAIKMNTNKWWFVHDEKLTFKYIGIIYFTVYICWRFVLFYHLHNSRRFKLVINPISLGTELIMLLPEANISCHDYNTIEWHCAWVEYTLEMNWAPNKSTLRSWDHSYSTYQNSNPLVLSSIQYQLERKWFDFHLVIFKGSFVAWWVQ